MTSFSAIDENSSLTDVLKAFPANSELLLLLAQGVMAREGELSRGEREAIAAFVSRLNDVPYCVFYHTMFSEVYSGPIKATDEKLAPLMTYARLLCRGTQEQLDAAFLAACESGWSEAAVYEVVEVCGLFNYINGIVRAANLKQPQCRPDPLPGPDDLRESYQLMANGLKQD
jgi:alkylhydroperoxidase family enzyme